MRVRRSPAASAGSIRLARGSSRRFATGPGRITLLGRLATPALAGRFLIRSRTAFAARALLGRSGAASSSATAAAASAAASSAASSAPAPAASGAFAGRRLRDDEANRLLSQGRGCGHEHHPGQGGAGEKELGKLHEITRMGGKFANASHST